MQQKRKRKLRASDFLITFICLLICAVSLWFFWKDLNSSTKRTDIDKIAIIHFKKKISQRKYNDRVVWERLQQDSELYNNDTVRTSDGAEAVIYFSDGAKVDLSENTMIQIVVGDDGKLNVSVSGGNIEVDTTSSKSDSVKLSLGDGSVVTLQKGSRASAEASETGGKSSLSVSNGNAMVASASGKTQELSGGEALSIEKNGEITKHRLTVTSIPKNLTVYKVNGRVEPVKLSWQADGASVAELASDKDFNNLIASESEKTSMDIHPQTGKLFWRVYLQDDKESALQGIINLVELDRMRLSAPLNSSVFTYRKELPSLHFTWQADEYVEYYRFEVSSTENFNSPLINENLKTNAYTTAALGKGNYYWRVTPYYSVNEIGYADSSEVNSFTLEEIKGVSAPLLTLPADNAKIILGENDQNVIFSWKSDVKTADYTIALSDSPDFKPERTTIKTSSTTIGNKFNIRTLPEGNYYWKVLRNSDEDLQTKNENAESEVRSFTVSAYVPGVNKLTWPPDGYVVERDQLERLAFSWKLASEYKAQNAPAVIQFAKSNDFNNVLIEETLADTDAEYSGASLSAGEYKWRVGVVVNGNETAFSEPYHLSVLDPALPVKLISPAGGQSFDGLAALRNPIQLIWEAEDQPVHTVLTLQKQNAEGQWINIRTMENAKNKIDLNRLTEGRYRWNVSASDKYGRAIDSQTEDFIITAVPPLPNASLVEPSFNLRMDGAYLKNHRNLTFKWKKVSGATDYDFAVYQILKNGTYKKIYAQNGMRQTEVKIKNLSLFDVGTFEWRVTAYSHAKDGFVEQQSKTAYSRFKIDFALPDKVNTKTPDTMYGE